MSTIDWWALFQTIDHPFFPAQFDCDLPRADKTAEIAKTPAASPYTPDVGNAARRRSTRHEAGFGSKGGIGLGLQNAIKAALELGAKFRIIVADVDIETDSELPDELRAALPADQLYAHLGAARADQAAIEFLAKLGKVRPVLITDAAAADFMMSDLDGADIIGLDYETGPPNARSESVRFTRNGTVAKTQPAPSKIGLDPYRSVIQVASLYAGGERVYVLRGDGLEHLLTSDWFARQHYVAHNAAFELKFARHRGLELRLECTLQAFGLLYGVENHNRRKHTRGLADAVKAVFGFEPPKGLQISCWSAPRLSAGQIAYAGADAVLPYLLWQKLGLRLRRNRLWGYELQRDAIPAVVDMERRGIGYDQAWHAQLMSEWRSKIAELETKIVELTGKPAPTKRNETQEWVESVAGDLLPTWKRTETGLLSTTAADYARLEDVPAARLILELRARKTLLANFGEKIARSVNPVTGRIHGGYKISGAKSGRFTCSEPNLQNQPSRSKAETYKRIFPAEPGYILLSGDLKQVELRAMAHVSGCPDMTAVFEAGDDMHLETALAMTDKKREELSTEELALLRTRAKAINFGIIFGCTGAGIVETAWKNYGIRMSLEEGDEELANFFGRFPRVGQWMKESFAEAARLGQIRIGAGRIVDKRWEKDSELSPQQCANLPIQGICADLILRALKLTFERLRAAKIDGGIIATVHDEQLLEVREDQAEIAKAILLETMTEAFVLTFPGAPTTGGVVDIKIGPSWGELQAPQE